MKDLETQYSLIFEKFMQTVSRQYMALLREVMVEERYVENHRWNALDMRTFADKVKAIREKLKKKPIYKNIFKAMEAVFRTVDGRIVRGIEKTYKQRKFPVPELRAKLPSAFKDAVAENVDLISGIVDKQATLLESAVSKAVKGGSDFKAVQKAVMAQSDKGIEYAKFVAADQVAKAYGAINKERQAASAIPGYIWQSMNDAKTRHTHRRPSGKFFLWGKAMPNDLRPRDKNGKILDPGEDYRCRCEAIPAFDQSDAQLFAKNKFDKAEPNR